MIMKKCIGLFLFIGILGACSDNGVKDRLNYLPDSTGKIDEIILAMEEDQWRGNSGEKLRATLMKDYGILPQREPIFDLRQAPGGDLVDLLKRSSVMLVVAILDQDNPTTEMVKTQLERIKKSGQEVPPYFVRKNVWSKPQRVMYLYGNNEQDLLNKLKEHEVNIIAKLHEIGDAKALTNNYIPGVSGGLTLTMKEKFNLEFEIPNKYEVAVDEDDFMWLRFDSDATEEVLNILVYSTPYKDTAPIMSQAFPIVLRNEAGKKVQSQKEGSYMFSDSILPFEQRFVKLGTQKAIESKGLWAIEHDFMGGPFVNYCLDDPKNKRTVCIDGFVYAPKVRKRLPMRKLTVLLNAIKLAE